ncbi:hypothetical protein [Pediococcus pentosaceus]|uniref:hypothetical protein n=1 Tax=Pediococcus pentosaceus TaxID=1255 RepID=UPI003982C785
MLSIELEMLTSLGKRFQQNLMMTEITYDLKLIALHGGNKKTYLTYGEGYEKAIFLKENKDNKLLFPDGIKFIDETNKITIIWGGENYDTAIRVE